MVKTSACLLIAIGVLGGSLLAQDRVVIRGGTIVNVRDGRLTPNGAIVLEGDRIVSVSPAGGTAPSGGTVIDAAGKYILPGLIDSHVHYADWSPELFLNHGVTTVVDLGSPHEWIKAQKEGIESGHIPGPRMFISTRNLEGPPESVEYFERPYVHIVKSPEEAALVVREYRKSNVDSVKVYAGLTLEMLRAIVQEANKANLPVIGHFKDVHDVADSGAHGVEHLDPMAHALLDKQAQQAARQKVRRGYAPPEEAFMDATKLPAVVDLMVKNKMYLNPTLRVAAAGDRVLREKGFPYEDFDLLLNDWRLRYIPLASRLGILKEYQEIGLWHWADLSAYEQELSHQAYVNSARMVKAFADAGGKLVAGTDCGFMCTGGLSLHQEMEMLVDAGVTPLLALQSATIYSAELMRLDDRLGTLEAGKAADVLILDANPLENIRNTRKIARVISRGRVLDGQYHPDFQNPIPNNIWPDTSHYFPSPEIRSASPEALVEGATGATVTVRGTGMIPYSFVLWNGQKLKTHFVSRLELTADLPAELLKPGTYRVTVENPDFAWGTIYAAGASNMRHMGIRDRISNEYLVLVKHRGGAPLYPHPGRTAKSD